MPSKDIPLPRLGIDILSEETSLPAGAVRKAVNIDLGRTGVSQVRDGYRRVIPSTQLHSLYAIKRSIGLLAIDGLTISYVNPTTFAVSALGQLNSAHPADFTEYNGSIYVVNRTSFMVFPQTSNIPVQCGLDKPQTPVLSAGAGPLLPGTYSVAVTTVSASGEESPASDVVQIKLTEVGGISVSSLPLGPGKTRVYASAIDGEVLYRAEEFLSVIDTALVSEKPDGAKLTTQHLSRFPGGDMVRAHNGRLYVANGSDLLFSEPLRPHLYSPRHGVIPFTGGIKFIEAVLGGVFVGDSRGVWFLEGDDPSTARLKYVTSCRAVARSSVMVPGEHFDPKTIDSELPVALWLSTSGYTVGLPDGSTKELHPDRIKVPTGLTGRSVFYIRNGRKQVLTPVNSSSTSVAEAAIDSVIP